MKKTVIRHICAFLASVVIAVLLLQIGAALPQYRVNNHVRDSVDRLLEEGTYPWVADKSVGSIMDNWTDAIILAQSKAMDISNPETILTNPMYSLSDGTTVEDLYEYAYAKDPEPTGAYPRYWMGFRAPMRAALCFLDYYQVKRYVAVLFFVLFAAVMCSVAQHTDAKAAFLFALSVILVRPHVVAISLQYSCCFLIAFFAMLAVPWISRHRQYASLFFLELGIITMYFDFYTTPIITFGLPLTYLYLLDERKGCRLPGKKIAAYAANWMGGYIGMWIAKLALTTMFTGLNGFQNAWASVVYRLGRQKGQSGGEEYGPGRALRSVWEILYSDEMGRQIILALCVLLTACLIVVSFRKKVRLSAWMEHKSLLVVAVLPLIWFMVAAQPTSIHACFQYRSVALCFWAGAVFFLSVFSAADGAMSNDVN